MFFDAMCKSQSKFAKNHANLIISHLNSSLIHYDLCRKNCMIFSKHIIQFTILLLQKWHEQAESASIHRF